MGDYNANIILSTAGTVFGLSIVEVQNILGLIITGLNLAILVISLILKLFKYIKNDGVLDKDELEDLSRDIDEIKKGSKQ